MPHAPTAPHAPRPLHASVRLQETPGSRGAFECQLSPQPSEAWMAMFLEPIRVFSSALGMRVWLNSNSRTTPSIACDPEDHERAVEVVQWCVDSANRAYATLSLPPRPGQSVSPSRK